MVHRLRVDLDSEHAWFIRRKGLRVLRSLCDDLLARRRLRGARLHLGCDCRTQHFRAHPAQWRCCERRHERHQRNNALRLTWSTRFRPMPPPEPDLPMHVAAQSHSVRPVQPCRQNLPWRACRRDWVEEARAGRLTTAVSWSTSSALNRRPPGHGPGGSPLRASAAPVPTLAGQRVEAESGGVGVEPAPAGGGRRRAFAKSMAKPSTWSDVPGRAVGGLQLKAGQT